MESVNTFPLHEKEQKKIEQTCLSAHECKGADFEGIIPVNKPKGMTSFQLVRLLRRHLGVRKIGHAGTLDPFAEGVMVMLVGRKYTRLSDSFLNQDKEYIGKVYLGITTDTYDCEGKIVKQSESVPQIEEIQEAVKSFQGEITQIPPMFSAKKVKGKKLYELARKGQEVERAPVTISVSLGILEYNYPELVIKVRCSKGTYIRSIAHDLGEKLGTGGHLSSLLRTRSGSFALEDCIEGSFLESKELTLQNVNGFNRKGKL